MFYEGQIWRGDRGNSLRRLRGKAATADVASAASHLPNEPRQFGDVWPFHLNTTLAICSQVIFWLGVLLGWIGATGLS